MILPSTWCEIAQDVSNCLLDNFNWNVVHNFCNMYRHHCCLSYTFSGSRHLALFPDLHLLASVGNFKWERAVRTRLFFKSSLIYLILVSNHNNSCKHRLEHNSQRNGPLFTKLSKVLVKYYYYSTSSQKLKNTYRIVFVNPFIQQYIHKDRISNSFLTSKVQWSIMILHEEYVKEGKQLQLRYAPSQASFNILLLDTLVQVILPCQSHQQCCDHSSLVAQQLQHSSMPDEAGCIHPKKEW